MTTGSSVHRRCQWIIIRKIKEWITKHQIQWHIIQLINIIRFPIKNILDDDFVQTDPNYRLVNNLVKQVLVLIHILKNLVERLFPPIGYVFQNLPPERPSCVPLGYLTQKKRWVNWETNFVWFLVNKECIKVG